MRTELEERLKGYDFAIEDASNREFIIDDLLGCFGDDSVLGKITEEIANKTIDAVLDYMHTQRSDMEIAFEEDEDE